MDRKKLRVALLTHHGDENILKRLVALETVEVAGVFVETETTPRRSFKEKLRRSIRYDGYWKTVTKFGAKLFGAKDGGAAEEQAAQDARNSFAETVQRLGVPLHTVRNYHDAASIDLIKAANPDLGVIWGTNIIKESVFGIPRLGSINIHQGLAQLYRGGPQAFWELFNDEKEVGVTVHYVAAKVDTGDIILQTTIPLHYDFERYGLDFDAFLHDFRGKLAEVSAPLVAEAVHLISEDRAPRIPQDVSQGKRYRLPVKGEKDELRKRLRARQRQAVKRTVTANSPRQVQRQAEVD